ncbi:MAG: tyrosine-type recombinase/integrase [Mariprofundaceae bacterium]|nr:tyrosine-type recombinase/integrase [Mariprofundaceae bacterium]
MKLKSLKVPNGQKQLRQPVGDGLYLLVRSTTKSWRWDYRLAGKRDTVSLGSFPSISLKQAQVLLADAKALQKNGINPRVNQQQIKKENLAKAAAKEAQSLEDANTFKAISALWLKKHETEWANSHYLKQVSRLDRHVLPAIGDKPMKQIEREDITAFLLLIAGASKHDTAKRCGQIVVGVFDYAFNTGLVDSIPIGNLNKVLPKAVSVKMPAITDPKELGGLLRVIDTYQGHITTKVALKLLPYLAVRGGEFRHAEWVEFDLNNALWTIPAHHRKLKRADQQDPNNVHLVPLCLQAVTLLNELKQYSQGKYLFASIRTNARPMSENTINAALAYLGYKGRHCGHGWRSAFSTLMNEQGFNADAIELQLAHVLKGVRGRYNRGEYLEERTRIMQYWADYLDGLRDGATVIPINRVA